ncbi:alpha/beta hydrolase [Vulgatibacter incomptus]|uniref:Lysophospholipase n=1 Tax=Vulgatibacter incomptus TaxID=1391653 RepID=A0A0K1PCN4_9BACT|nr:alpha/beta hydrolase [Vulgatibacter incomptus]AKU90879.1 Lysophospholipase [Vulgatibacter incomptus]
MKTAIPHEEGFFPAKDNLRLYWQSYLPTDPRAEVGFIHGYGDHSGRWTEFLELLASRGFAVHAFDYRGHGQADGRRGHVDAFDEYLDDLELFLGRIEARRAGRKLFLVGHSHGGLMLARYLESRWHGGGAEGGADEKKGISAHAKPEAEPRKSATAGTAAEEVGPARAGPASSLALSAAVFSSPYLRLAFEPPWLKVQAALLIGKVVPWLPVSGKLPTELLSQDPAWQEASDRDPLYGHTTTPRWFTESTSAQAKARAEASKITLPSLVQVPECDGIADPATGEAFFRDLGASDKELVVYPGGRHELYHELAETKMKSMDDAAAFLERHLGGGA